MRHQIKWILPVLGFGFAASFAAADEAALKAQILKLQARVAELEKALADCQKAPAPDAEKTPTPTASGHDGDRFIKTTSVDGRKQAEFEPKSLNWVAGTRHDHRLGMIWHRDDKSEGLVFTLTTYASGRKYHDLTSVDLIIDDKTVSLPVLDYDSRLRRVSIGGRRVRADDESFRLELNPAMLKQLGAARSIRIQMREVIYAFSDVHLIGLSAMARQQP